MKAHTLPKKEFDLTRFTMSHNNKKQYLECSRDENESIVCGCCKKIFFTRNEFLKLISAEKKLRRITGELERMDEENRKQINDIYTNSTVSVLDMYIPNPQLDKNIVSEEFANVNKQIFASLDEKHKLQKQLKLYVGFTDEDEELISKMYHIKTKCVVNCCHDCSFGWYCDKCCFTLKSGTFENKTCGITLMTRLLNINNCSGRYGMLSEADIYLLQNRFINDMKYGINPNCLRGKSANIDELRDEQKKKFRKNEI